VVCETVVTVFEFCVTDGAVVVAGGGAADVDGVVWRVAREDCVTA